MRRWNCYGVVVIRETEDVSHRKRTYEGRTATRAVSKRRTGRPRVEEQGTPRIDLLTDTREAAPLGWYLHV
jgi:hypothetical protein